MPFIFDVTSSRRHLLLFSWSVSVVVQHTMSTKLPLLYGMFGGAKTEYARNVGS